MPQLFLLLRGWNLTSYGFLVAFAFACFATTGASAANITVTTLADSGTGSLRQALLTAAANDIITFQSGLTGTITLKSRLPNFKGNLTIQGPGPDVISINGANLYRIFDFGDLKDSNDFTVQTETISGLTLENGNDITSGGGDPYGDGNGGGGAVVLTMVSMDMSNCVLSNNTTVYFGGAVGFNGSTTTPTTCTLTNCTLTGNKCTTADYSGGAIENGPGGTLALINCTLSDNQAGAGGAIDGSYPSTTTVSNCTFDSNSATGGAGAIDAIALTATGCLFTGNTGAISAFNATIANCTFYANIGLNDAVCVSVIDSDEITNCTFTKNTENGVGLALFPAPQSAIENCILYGDIGNEIQSGSSIANAPTNTISHCDIQGGFAETGITDAGGNIASDPLLGPLADNGGPTQTAALGDGSPCVGAGTAVGAPTTDQRGVTRPNPPSIGAYDVGAATVYTFPAGLAMISTPEGYAGTPIQTVLGYANPVLAAWDPSSAMYNLITAGNTTALVQGAGLWIRFPQTTSIMLTGTTTPNAPFSIPLTMGWNIVGDPFTSQVPLTSLEVQLAGGATESYGVATSTSVLASPFYGYQQSPSQYIVATDLVPYAGYWIDATQNCTLIVPNP